MPTWSPAHHLGIAIPSIATLLNRCNQETPRGLRDRVLLCIGQDLGRRSQDFHLFDLGDFTRRPDGRGNALIRMSKTDQRGEGCTKAISAKAIDAIIDWELWRAEHARDAESALLVGINQSGVAGGNREKWSATTLQRATTRLRDMQQIDGLKNAPDTAARTADRVQQLLRLRSKIDRVMWNSERNLAAVSNAAKICRSRYIAKPRSHIGGRT